MADRQAQPSSPEDQARPTSSGSQAQPSSSGRRVQASSVGRRARPSAPDRPAWLPVLVRGAAVLVAGYLAALSALVCLLSGSDLITREPPRTLQGVALIAGGALVLPLLLYYGAATLTARSSPLTRTWKARLGWALTACALTLLLLIVLDFQFAPFPLAALPAAFIVGRRTLRAAFAGCALLLCLLLILW